MTTAKDLNNGSILNLDGMYFRVMGVQHNLFSHDASHITVLLEQLASGQEIQHRFRVSDRLEQIRPNRTETTYLYRAHSTHVFRGITDSRRYGVLDRCLRRMVLGLLEEDTPCTLLSDHDFVFGVELPPFVVRKIASTGPVTSADGSPRAMKSARLTTGLEVTVPASCARGELIEVDTSTGGYRRHAES